MIRVEERRRRARVSPLDEWLRDAGGMMVRRLGRSMEDGARRAWEGTVRLLATVTLVAAGAVFLLLGSVQLLKELRLPAWLAYGLLGALGLLAAFLLWRSALAPLGGRR